MNTAQLSRGGTEGVSYGRSIPMPGLSILKLVHEITIILEGENGLISSEKYCHYENGLLLEFFAIMR